MVKRRNRSPISEGNNENVKNKQLANRKKHTFERRIKRHVQLRRPPLKTGSCLNIYKHRRRWWLPQILVRPNTFQWVWIRWWLWRQVRIQKLQQFWPIMNRVRRFSWHWQRMEYLKFDRVKLAVFRKTTLASVWKIKGRYQWSWRCESGRNGRLDMSWGCGSIYKHIIGIQVDTRVSLDNFWDFTIDDVVEIIWCGLLFGRQEA